METNSSLEALDGHCAALEKAIQDVLLDHVVKFVEATGYLPKVEITARERDDLCTADMPPGQGMLEMTIEISMPVEFDLTPATPEP